MDRVLFTFIMNSIYNLFCTILRHIFWLDRGNFSWNNTECSCTQGKQTDSENKK